MKVICAEEMGFCFGVKRALDMTEKALREGKRVKTIGPLIHNPQVIKFLEQKGVEIVDDVNRVNSGLIVIRAHGITPEAYKVFREKKLEIIDATCPYVKVTQVSAKKLYEEGYQVVIIGEKDHPEVIGIRGNIPRAIVIGKEEEVNSLKFYPRLGIVAQTTQSLEKFSSILRELLLKSNELKIYNTICEATKKRQEAAVELSKKVDSMLVIGGRNSSNTRRLYELCSEFTQVLWVETKEELRKDQLSPKKRIGITAGASTPNWVIQEIIDVLRAS